MLRHRDKVACRMGAAILALENMDAARRHNAVALFQAFIEQDSVMIFADLFFFFVRDAQGELLVFRLLILGCFFRWIINLGLMSSLGSISMP